VKPFTVSTPNVVTLKQIAARSGHAVATVSYALRNHPKIPEETRRKVREVAQALGYRPNPRVASLMAHIRQAQARPAGERIAFVWVQTSRQMAEADPFLRVAFSGAQRRAEQAGFALEEFWAAEPGMTDRRLQDILRARGIVGVVLSPVTTADSALALDWDWSLFAAAVIGNVSWTPELHHAGHHHFLGMKLALDELAKLGCRRPAALIEGKVNERAKRAWEAAFLTHHPVRSRAPACIRVTEGDAETARWLEGTGADALIVSGENLRQVRGVREVCRRRKLKVATLYWSKETRPEIGGVDQGYDRVAAHAVDLVVAQLNNNECGVPEVPGMMLFPGRWVAARRADR
jgi:LacI family transcriptional regulator